MIGRVTVVLGTRPELIKLAPLILELRQPPAEAGTRPLDVFVCSTGQHRHLLAPLWSSFGLRPDADLAVMREGASLAETASRILAALPAVWEQSRPDLVLVQGDTTTTFCAALAAFYQHIPVAHVEAGLRTHNLEAPFPEELNRVMVGRIARWHFAPTAEAAANLRREGVPEERIHVTGNTGIDALRIILAALAEGRLQPAVRFPPPIRPRIALTAHRRESFADGLSAVCGAINRLLEEQDLEVVLPLHPNPGARQRMLAHLKASPRLLTCEALDYVSFLALLQTCTAVITDSGGIQEEAPYLGIPVVVIRAVTERNEGITAGLASLVGYDSGLIYAAALQSLAKKETNRLETSSHNIYGDGWASRRISALIHSFESE